MALIPILLALFLAASSTAQSNGTIPDFILSYAPLVYLDVNEEYYPSDIAAQVKNTYPALNFSAISNASANLILSNLSGLNAAAGCSSFSTCKDLYLTSKDRITVKPTEQWLRGVLPDANTGETVGATSTAVIVVDHSNGTIDAFYMFFYAFNYGIPVGSPNGTVYDDHVGDWEHIMVRFVQNKPSIVYYSIHNGGMAYTYDAVLKNGTRPLGFSSKGGHATYAQEGTHVMYAGAANDSTSRGPLWDPVAGSGAWFYTFKPNNTDGTQGVFQAVDVPGHTARGVGPSDWLYYYGRWGDKQYNSSYPGQASLVGRFPAALMGSLTSVFQDGPTGPLDKDLYRSGACPDNSGSCSTRTQLEASSGTAIAQTVSRTSTTSPATTTSGGIGTATKPAATSSSTSTNAAATGLGSRMMDLVVVAAVVGAAL